MSEDARHAYLCAEIEATAPLDFVAVAPVGGGLMTLQIGRDEDGGLLLVVPARPPGAPPLPQTAIESLDERGFVSLAGEDDPLGAFLARPADAEAAATQARAILGEVFGVPAETSLDIVHGSRQAEVAVRRKLALIRERVGKVLTVFTDGEAPATDDDGDFQLPLGDVRVSVAPRALPNGPVVVRIFAITNVRFETTPELGLFLARLNFGMMFGRFALDIENNAIWFDETLLGEHFTDEELRFAVQVVATTADEWDDRIKQMFGGLKYQETIADENGSPLVKPGEGRGLYL